jgi:hypothetical protein
VKHLADCLLRRAQRRAPDFIIGGADDPYLLRWWLIPRNPVFNVYLHCFVRSDDDRALHTHPWLFNLSWLLRGQYREWSTETRFDDRIAGDVKFRWGAAAHRVELFRAGLAVGNAPPRPVGRPMPCWTLFVTGPRVRQWGFLCPQGFVHWKRFTATGDKGAIGQGCEP